MNEAEARQLADKYLAGRPNVRMKAGRVVETPRSWIFEAASVDGEVLFGNVPVVVDKHAGTVVPLKATWREFASNLPASERLKRWWSRRQYY